MKKQPTKTRAEIAKELMRGCPSESQKDHEVVANAIVSGVLLSGLLEMLEVNRWPETCAWLVSEFKALDANYQS